MSPPICGQCKHWVLKGSGYLAGGRCSADPDPVMRVARTYGPQINCRFGKFEKADIKVIVMREKVLAGAPA